MHELARLYMESAQPAKAGDVYGRLLEINAHDLLAVKGSKDAAAAASSRKAAGTGGGHLRDLIKDKDQAVALEQLGRVYRSEDMIDYLLGDLSEKYTQDPQNVDTARRIAELYEERNDLENAVMWLAMRPSSRRIRTSLWFARPRTFASGNSTAR